MDSVQAAARLAEIREDQRNLRDEAAHLERLVSHPSVDVVLVYWRHGSLVRQVSSETLEAACRYLDYGSEEGSFARVGVEVNGVLVEDWEDHRA